MWWAILNPVRRINELSPLYRIAYIFLASLALMPIGFFHLLNLNANYVLYFPTEAMIIPQLTNIYDQQLAGGILKLIQLSSFIFVMYRIDRKSTRLNSSHVAKSYAVLCLQQNKKADYRSHQA